MEDNVIFSHRITSSPSTSRTGIRGRLCALFIGERHSSQRPTLPVAPVIHSYYPGERIWRVDGCFQHRGPVMGLQQCSLSRPSCWRTRGIYKLWPLVRTKQRWRLPWEVMPRSLGAFRVRPMTTRQITGLKAESPTGPWLRPWWMKGRICFTLHSEKWRVPDVAKIV